MTNEFYSYVLNMIDSGKWKRCVFYGIYLLVI